jgi:hypothetical protein
MQARGNIKERKQAHRASSAFAWWPWVPRPSHAPSEEPLVQRRGFKNGGGCWSRHLVGTCVGVALRFPGTCGNTLGRFGSGPIFWRPHSGVVQRYAAEEQTSLEKPSKCAFAKMQQNFWMKRGATRNYSTLNLKKMSATYITIKGPLKGWLKKATLNMGYGPSHPQNLPPRPSRPHRLLPRPLAPPHLPPLPLASPLAPPPSTPPQNFILPKKIGHASRTVCRGTEITRIQVK